MKRFEGKVCLVTASTAGIGLAIAERMAVEGGNVIICSRKQENVDEALVKLNESIQKSGSKGSAIGIAANVGRPEDRKKLVDLVSSKYGKLDVLVPNAAVSTHFGSQFDISEKAYDKLWDLNVKATFYLIKETIELIRNAGEGANILITSSVAGKEPNFTIGLYGSCKAAIDNMVKWMKDELRSDGIRVNSIAPGLIKTDFAAPLWGNPEVPKDSIGLSENIGAVAATMTSSDGAFINGTTFYVHGGYAKL